MLGFNSKNTHFSCLLFEKLRRYCLKAALLYHKVKNHMVNCGVKTRVKKDMTNNKKEKQSYIKDHGEETEFLKVIHEGLVNGGIHVNASKGHGKARLLFSMAQSLRNLEKQRNIDFSKVPLRRWFYEGNLFESPLWK